jgi:hypothetical protein
MIRRVLSTAVVTAVLIGSLGCGEKSPGEKRAERRADILRRGNELEESVRRFGLEYPEFSVDTVERVSDDIASIARMGVEISAREQRGAISADEAVKARAKVAALQKAALEMTQLRALREQLRRFDESATEGSR